MRSFFKNLKARVFFLATLVVLPATSMAALLNYDSGSNTWGVTDWGTFGSPGAGAFAPSTFTGYTSTNGVAMLRNDNLSGWWIGDVQVSTFSSFYAGDDLSIDVTGATWGGIVDYFTTQAAGSNFYAAMNNSGDMIDLTGLSIGDSVNGTFSWSGSVNNIELNYVAAPSSIPEPSTFAILGIGLLGLALRRKRV